MLIEVLADRFRVYISEEMLGLKDIQQIPITYWHWDGWLGAEYGTVVAKGYRIKESDIPFRGECFLDLSDPEKPKINLAEGLEKWTEPRTVERVALILKQIVNGEAEVKMGRQTVWWGTNLMPRNDKVNA